VVLRGESRLGGIAKTLLFACRGFPLFATVRENGCFKPSLGHLQEDALLPIAPRSFCPVHALVRELPIFLRRHDAAPIRAMNCRISGELFEPRTVKIKRGHARPEPCSCVGHLPNGRSITGWNQSEADDFGRRGQIPYCHRPPSPLEHWATVVQHPPPGLPQMKSPGRAGERPGRSPLGCVVQMPAYSA
jgi:hypothetical protein